MQTTRDYVWVAILIPLALWAITRTGSFQSKGYKRPGGVKLAAWLGVALLTIWVAREIVLPYFD